MIRALEPGERRALLEVARAAIGARWSGSSELSRALARCGRDCAPRVGGLFVTLTAAGRLRGCIGVIRSTVPLCREVAAIAPRAAFEDPRFPPLEPSELPGVSISLSVLDEPARVDAKQIVVGRDGVELRVEERRSVFLPHVAVDQGWDRNRLLEQLATKAGLEPSAWSRAELYAFRSQTFGERDQLRRGGSKTRAYW